MATCLAYLLFPREKSARFLKDVSQARCTTRSVWTNSLRLEEVAGVLFLIDSIYTKDETE